MKCIVNDCQRAAVNEYVKHCYKHMVTENKNQPLTRKDLYPHHVLYKNPKWEKLRQLKLSNNPICEKCSNPGNQIDHIVPHKGNVYLFFELANLQTLCISCHSAKTMMENKISRLTNSYDNYVFLMKSNEIKNKLINEGILDWKDYYINDLVKQLSRNDQKIIYIEAENLSESIDLLYLLSWKMKMKIKVWDSYSEWKQIISWGKPW